MNDQDQVNSPTPTENRIITVTELVQRMIEHRIACVSAYSIRATDHQLIAYELEVASLLIDLACDLGLPADVQRQVAGDLAVEVMGL